MNQRHPLAQRRPGRAGFILVTVLTILVLMVMLIVAFLLRATTERTSAAGYQASAAARQLADTAVNLVQGQINLATTQGSTVAWVSQPGMVRDFDQSGNLLTAYKLYSAANMISGQVQIANGQSADAPPSAWSASPALWTDLNAPVQVPGGAKIFPSLDPAATAAGYSVTAAPGATTYQAVPMPVLWLYVLQDGTLVAPTGNGNSATVPGETATNKIVGRIAFWTDDETCKVNINTASAGTFWDVPRAYSTTTLANGVTTGGLPTAGSLTQEQALGYYQPVQDEFQRYPGHPAMTDLRAVFGASLTPEQIYPLTPRILGGGSTEGTVKVTATGPISGYPKTDRLYDSVDELLFAPARSANPGLTPAQIEQERFFLTAHSRAPETNLFNLPRIACWPINADLASHPSSPFTTAFDRLIAFCASTGAGAAGSALPYYFQRQNALSATNDIGISRNQTLYSYLQYLTSQVVPGFGGSTFAAKYGADRDQILTEIFDYIRCVDLYDSNLAAANTFTATAKGCVVPTVHSAGGSSTMGLGRTYTLSKLALGFICNADANLPASNLTTGSTANLVLGGVALGANQKYIQAIMIPGFFSAMCGFISLMPDMQVTISGLSSLQINGQAIFPAAADGATVTYNTNYPNVLATDTGMNRYGADAGWRFFAVSTKTARPIRASPARGNLPVDISITDGIDDPYPFIGTPIVITDTAGTMIFSGGTVTVKISDPAGNTVQTIPVNFPAATFPTPKIVNTGTASGGSGISATTQDQWWTYRKQGPYALNGEGRLSFFSQDPGTPGTPYAGAFFLSNFDVIRTMVVPHGDYRLVAASPSVAASVFQPQRYYSTTTQTMASNLGNSSNTGCDPGYDTGGKYFSTITYPSGHQPDIAASEALASTPQANGDYDDPLPDFFPGPYANKPDEGAVATTGKTDSIPYYASVSQTTSASTSVDQQPDGGTFFSPNRMMPSPGMFGSLPSGVVAGKPWQTLLFRNQPAHPGAASPPDHLLLDLFWMPIVEPYAISDRFSTAGKINMNYQILPFTYLTRSTGLQALLYSEMVTAMPNSLISVYKVPTGGTKTPFRTAINISQTLTQFDSKFATGDVFRSPSEICDLEIVPTGQTVAGMTAFWTNNQLTGDNVRERIYTMLYPRLTTKSNTFTVHFQAQSLSKASTSTLGTWTEGKDLITGEYRGSTTIERFIDANNTAIPDYAANAASIASLPTLDTFYRWRVIANRQFNP